MSFTVNNRVIALNVNDSAQKYGIADRAMVMSYTQRAWIVDTANANAAELIFACRQVDDGWQIIGVYERADGESWLSSVKEPDRKVFLGRPSEEGEKQYLFRVLPEDTFTPGLNPVRYFNI